MQKTAVGFPNYEITDDGRVWSKPRQTRGGPRGGKWLKLFLVGGGYPSVMLWRGREYRLCKVHRLVLETFVGPCPEGMEACHANDVKTDNRLENLRWDTPVNNQQEKKRNGRCKENMRPGLAGRTAEEVLTDAQADDFFRQAVIDGRMTSTELHELSGLEALPAPDEWKDVSTFIALLAQEFGWPEEDAGRMLQLRLEQERLTEQHILVYLNYPSWTMVQIAKRLGVGQSAVSRMISRMRQVFPGLRLDVSVDVTAAYPALHHMRHIECTSTATDWLNEDEVIKF